MLRLPELQRAFFRAIASPPASDTAIAADADLLAEMCGDDRLTAAGRVGVYGRMYAARLIDVLVEDYPRVAALLGEERFAAAAREYLAAHPSTHPSLRWFGRDFASFLGDMTGADLPAFTVDLARLEWTRLAVFDARDAGSLSMDALRAIPPQEWPGLRLHLIPAVEVLHAQWPVHRIWDAVQPASAGEWLAEETWLRVWRQDTTVYQASMDATERTALAHLQRGDDFSTLCAGLATVVPQDEAATTAAGLVARWIADGVLLERTPPAP